MLLSDSLLVLWLEYFWLESLSSDEVESLRLDSLDCMDSLDWLDLLDCELEPLDCELEPLDEWLLESEELLIEIERLDSLDTDDFELESLEVE